MEKIISIPYTPRPQQQELHDQLNKYRFGVCVMHRRGGKSTFGVNHLIKLALTTDRENFRGAMFAPTRVQIKLISWDMIKHYTRIIPGMKYNETELRADFPNGSRIQLFGSENPDSARGQFFDFVFCDEYAQMDERMFPEIIRPAIADRKGGVCFIGTPNGMDAFYDLHEKAKADPEWYTITWKASETKLVDKKELEQMRKLMTPDQYDQEMECSWMANRSGAVFAKFVQEIEEKKHITRIPYDPGYPVDCYFDLGISDKCCIIFVQQIGRSFNIIDTYSNNNEGLDHYAQVIRERDYFYRNFIFPHDIETREMSTGKSRKEYAYSLGLKPLKVCPKLPKEDQIHAAQLFLSKCFFDLENSKPLLDSLKWYHRKYLDKQRTYSKPVHDWSSHFCDSFMNAAVATSELDLNDSMPKQFAADNNYNPLGA
tara:strand:- start:4699 stop:5982 length:1284 start_codon:yes stop_codon:yes gene_type:complete